MALETMWYFTQIPDEIVNSMEEFVKNYDNHIVESRLHGNTIDERIRKSENAWVATTNWVSGFLWYYIARANRENFLYDIKFIDGESMQYTSYCMGEYYKWHCDASLNISSVTTNNDYHHLSTEDFINQNCEYIRKLSFSLQLSDIDDYEGGQLQFLSDDGKTYFAPKKKGTLIIFDSRVKHRVLKVTKGQRKSLVGWVVGPRWK